LYAQQRTALHEPQGDWKEMIRFRENVFYLSENSNKKQSFDKTEDETMYASTVLTF